MHHSDLIKKKQKPNSLCLLDQEVNELFQTTEAWLDIPGGQEEEEGWGGVGGGGVRKEEEGGYISVIIWCADWLVSPGATKNYWKICISESPKSCGEIP